MNNRLACALFFFYVCAYAQNTPVIGGSCKTGTPDVQIGAKQTQFFLKCEANDDSQDGSGIWVVKSRAAAAPGSNENQMAQQHPKKMHKQMSNICEQDSSAREGQACTTSETCLQQNYEQAGSYLQCDSSSQRWIKRNCQQDFVFSFEHQSCIGHTKTIRHVARQAASGGVICTYTQCNNNSPCNIGTCNNGYCCSSAPIAPIQVTQSCPQCNVRVPQVIQIRCPGGGMPYGTCNGGYCSAGYQCIQSTNMCCATVRQISTCPGGRISTGNCMNGRCSSGSSCNMQTNACCPVATVCPDGTQAAGACVNNQCGTGFTCTNNLCCSSSSATPRCLDGSSAVGACINGRCGSGFTCTTGNICCPSTLTVCPVGQTSIGRCVNNQCPTGYTCVGTAPNNYCCGTATTTTCPAVDASGPCIDGACPTGYVCDTEANNCCPNVDYNAADSLGPCIGGTCPAGYACILSLGDADGICLPFLDDGATDSAGPCVGGLCPAGFTCDTASQLCLPS